MKCRSLRASGTILVGGRLSSCRGRRARGIVLTESSSYFPLKLATIIPIRHDTPMPTSSPVTTNQSGPHPRLEAVVRRHLEHPWRQPIRAHGRAAFAALEAWVGGDIGALVVDAGCGTGASTALLARRHPDCRVIGIDKSRVRLARAPTLPGNARLARMDLADFWRLARAAGWRLQRHCMLYPNPWPKAEHLMRRWYAHPVFPDVLALGGRLEVRSNWPLYLLEFRTALAVAGHDAAVETLRRQALGRIYRARFAD